MLLYALSILENLMSVTNEMTNVDSEIGKLRRDLAMKDAEIMRLNQDIVDGAEQLQDEKNAHQRTSESLENNRVTTKDNQKNIVILQGKVYMEWQVHDYVVGI